MRVPQLLAFSGAVLILGGIGASAVLQPGSAPGMTEAAQQFLNSLPDKQRALAALPYDSPARTAWHFIPKPFEGEGARTGVTIKSMSPESRKLALGLLRTGLSAAGFEQAHEIMKLESILGVLEGPKPGRAFSRDPEMYYFNVFGTPGDGRWGWRCEGHHLSLSFVVDGTRVVSATPAFFGSNPADVPEGPKKGFRVLDRREDLARELLKGLDESQHKIAYQDKKAPDDLRGGGVVQPEQTAPVGLPASKLNETQQRLLRMLLEEYAQCMAADVASTWIADLDKAGFGNIHFAWWGGENRGDGHYYRLQGPTFVVEYNNTQNNANHVHSMWRNLSGDFALPLAAKK